MDYLTTLGAGIVLGLIFMLKFGLLNFWLNYVVEQADSEKAKNTKNKIAFNALKRCLGLSLILTFIYYSSDGSYCVSQDMFGCNEYEYDDEHVPATASEAFRFFGIILTVTVVGSYYKLSKKYLI
jgi:hypothetical protein